MIHHLPNNEHDVPRMKSLVPMRGAVSMYEYLPGQDSEPAMGRAILDLIARATVSTVTHTQRDRGSESRKGLVLLISPQRQHVQAVERYLNMSGGDCRRIRAHTCRYRSGSALRAMRLPGDAARLRDDILACGADLVVIDLLNELLADDAGSSEQQKVQQARAGLEHIAAETNVAIVVGIVRVDTAHLSTPHSRAYGPPSDDSATTTLPPSGPIHHPMQRHRAKRGDVSLNAVARRNVREAIEFLRRVLARGPCSRRYVECLASLRGLKPRTLRTAREKLGIRVWKSQTANGPWVWELPIVRPMTRDTD